MFGKKLLNDFKSKQIYSMKHCISIFILVGFFSIIDCEKLFSQSSSLDSIKQHEVAISMAKRFISVVNSGDRDSIAKFVLQSYGNKTIAKFSMPTIISFDFAIYLESGGLGFDIKEINVDDAGTISITVNNRLTNCYLRLDIPTSGAPDFSINNVFMPKLLSISKADDIAIGDNYLLNNINICLEKMKQEKEFSGVILITHNEKVLLKQAVGMANISYKVPNQIDTKFNIASIGKLFTGVAVAKLVKEGKLSYDDTISKYIPSDWLNQKVSSRIQVKHLLTHTSGLGDYFSKIQKYCDIPYFRELNDYKPLLMNDTLLFNPGSRFSYSNAGLLLAGVIIESVSHESYFSYLRNNIFIPLGMSNTDGYDKDFPAPNTATGYTKVIDNGVIKWNNNLYTRVMRGSPSGGIYSTADDLMKFAFAIRNHQLFSPEYQEMLVQSRPELNVPFHGYLFFNAGAKTNRQVSHSGDGQGANCYFKMYLDSGYSYIILSNMSRPSANILADVLDQLLLKRK